MPKTQGSGKVSVQILQEEFHGDLEESTLVLFGGNSGLASALLGRDEPWPIKLKILSRWMTSAVQS